MSIGVNSLSALAAGTPNTPVSIQTISTVSPSTNVYSFSDAVAAGQISIQIYGSGSSSGDSINVDIQRLVNYEIEIEPFPLGTQLVTSGDYQNMVIYELKGLADGDYYYPRSRIVLSSPGTATYVFSAYCLDFDKSNPETYTTFSSSGYANSDVIKILGSQNSLSSSVASVAAIQTAIWSVTDNISLNQLSSTFPDGVNEVSNAERILNAAGVPLYDKQLFGYTGTTPPETPTSSPTATRTPIATPKNNPATVTPPTGNFFEQPLMLAAIAAIILVIVIVVIVLKLKRRKKTPQTPYQRNMYPTPPQDYTQQPPTAPQQTTARFCGLCGNPVQPATVICPNCGKHIG